MKLDKLFNILTLFVGQQEG